MNTDPLQRPEAAATDPDLQALAEQALGAMRQAGFEAARADASLRETTELNIAHSEPSLLRSLRAEKLVLTGLIDQRLASTELSRLGDAAALAEGVAALRDACLAAPRDEAQAITAGQRARIVQGPPEADEALLADKVAELLAWRAAEAPAFVLEEGFAAHTRQRVHTLSSGGSDLSCDIGCYGLSVMGSAREGRRTSSFNHADGQAHDLRERPAAAWFGIDRMMLETCRQLDAQPVAEKFVGEVVLSPMAVGSLIGWLLGQIGDLPLIAGTSLYRDRVGQAIASPLLSLASRFDAPGVAALSADGFAAPPLQLLRDGRLQHLTPGLYASRKTGLAQVPVAAAGGWALAAGETPLAALLAGVPRGALVGRLSMGSPASNGDFSGVIKNSFLIEGGQVGGALREVMISGNVARMLQDVLAVSSECIDTGTHAFPWLRIGGLHFS